MHTSSQTRAIPPALGGLDVETCRGVSQPGNAPTLGAHYPTPTGPSTTLTSLCFQQFAESAFRSKLNPNGMKTSDSGTLLAHSWHR